MPQPTAYTRSFGYTDFSASYPSAPMPGTSLDAEFNAVAATFAGVLANLALIQRDDGALKNQIVTLDSLSPAVILALGAGVIWLPRGVWLTATAYSVSDVVSSGTATYVCGVAHTSGVFATDAAAGKWTKLYDDGGSTPADGSVTAPKLGPGSVTTPKIGFDGLDLAKNIRAGVGLQAGIAPLGSLMHAKSAVGDVMAKVERTTDAQGAVGYQIIGITATWQISMAASASVLEIKLGAGAVATFTAEAGLDVGGAVRATTGVAPAAGAGIGLRYTASVGYLDAIDYTNSLWKPIRLRGQSITLSPSAVDVLVATPTGVDIIGTASRGGVDLGWLDVPQNEQDAAYTLALSDRGKHIYSTNMAGQSVAVPVNAAVAFPAGTAILIVNDGSSPITITTAGITMKLSGSASTGDRTLAPNGVASLLKVGTDRWFISGSGVT